MKCIIFAVGCLSFIFGIIGIFLPILPTAPLIVFAALCFANTSPKIYGKIASSKYFGAFIENYKNKTGINLRVKITAVIFLWLTLIISCCIFKKTYHYIILSVVGIAVSVHIFMIKTKK